MASISYCDSCGKRESNGKGHELSRLLVMEQANPTTFRAGLWYCTSCVEKLLALRQRIVDSLEAT
jgi:hypothetical protein